MGYYSTDTYSMSFDNSDFTSGDAHASLTRPLRASAVRKGGYAMLKGFPCKVVEMAVAHPGKHGHSKIHFIGLDIFTGRKHEDITPSQEMIEVPNISRCEYQLINISDGYLELMDQAGKLRKDVMIARGALRDKTTVRWEEGEDLLANVMSGMGQSVVMAIRNAPNN